MKNVISQKIKWSPLGPSINQVKQYGSRNNIIISDIPDDKSDNDLESTVIDIMKDVDVNIKSSDIERSLP